MATAFQLEAGSDQNPIISQYAHAEIVRIKRHLQRSFSYSEALMNAHLWGRSYPNGGRSEVDSGLLFELGKDSRFMVSLGAEPVRESPKVLRSYDVREWLSLLRLDPNPEVSVPVASLLLRTQYQESPQGQVKRWQTGSIDLVENDRLEPDPLTAIHRSRQVFAEIYRL